MVFLDSPNGPHVTVSPTRNVTGGFGLTSGASCVSGIVTVGAAWQGGAPPAGSATLMLRVDGTPIVGSMMAIPYSYSWDSTGVANGTHVLDFLMIDSTSAAGNAYRLAAGIQAAQVIVGNPSSVFGPGAMQGAQDIWVTAQVIGVSNQYPSTPDKIHYSGSPSTIANTVYPTNYSGINPVLPASVDGRYSGSLATLFDPSLWYAEANNEYRWQEYCSTPGLQTTQLGGVFVHGWTPQVPGLAVETAYDPIVRMNPWDGGRLDNQTVPWIEYVEHPGGIGWAGAEIHGRISLYGYDGSVTTLFGYKRDRTVLSLDSSDNTVTEAQVTRVAVGTTSGAGSPFDLGGCNDLCFDPRDTRDHAVSFTATIAGTTMTVTGSPTGSLRMGTVIATGAAPQTRVVAFGTGSGGAGTYTISPSQTVSSPTAMTGGTSALIYVTMVTTSGNFIAQIDMLHSGAPNAVVYAGIPDSPGYVDTTATGGGLTAKFASPYSIDMADGTGPDPAGTMYVADRDNNAIRKVWPRASGYIGADAAGVTTLMGGSLHTQPDFPTYSANFSTYFKGVAPWPAISAGYCLQPGVLRMTSAQGFVFMGLWDYNVMHASLATNELKWVFAWDNLTPHAATHPFPWLDVDKRAACGPLDAIVAGVTDASTEPGHLSFVRYPLDGSSRNGWSAEPASGAYHQREGLFTTYLFQFGAYGWSVAYGRIYGRMIGGAIGTPNPVSLRIASVADLAIPQAVSPPYGGQDGAWISWFVGSCVSQVDFGGGVLGTVPIFPYNYRPSFWNLMGAAGVSHYTPIGGGAGINTIDDLWANFSSNIGNYDLSPGDPANAGTLVAYFQAGLGGVVPRPELTGNHLRNLVYEMLRTTTQGSWPTAFALPSMNADATAPVITITSATHTGTTLTVTWTTDKPTLGMVCAGSPAQQGYSYGSPYNLFQMESYVPGVSGYKTTGHTATVTNLPSVSPIHYSVIAKDLAGNPSFTSDETVT